MKKLLLTLLLALAVVPVVQAGTTTVTATVQDPNGQVFANGTVTAQFVPNPNRPGEQYTTGGLTFPKVVIGALDAGGSFSIIVTDNTTIDPALSKWQFTVCSNTTAPCVVLSGITISTAGQSITTQINFVTPVIQISANRSPAFSGVAYVDAEVQNPVAGTSYFNITSKQQKFFDGASWVAPSTGTVNSVAMTVPSWLSVGGSPIVLAGTLAVTAAGGQASHQVIGTCNALVSFGPCTLTLSDLPTQSGSVNICMSTNCSMTTPSLASPTLTGTITATGTTYNGGAVNGTTVVASTSLSVNGSQAATGLQGSTGLKLFACTGSFTSGNFVKSDANGNCVDGGSSVGFTTLDKQDPAAGAVGDGTDKTIYTYTMPTSTLASGKCIKIDFWYQRSAGVGVPVHKIFFGATAVNTSTLSGTSSAVLESYSTVCNNAGSTTAQWSSGASFDNNGIFSSNNVSPAETTGSGTIVIKGTFNVSAATSVAGKGWRVELMP